MTTPVPGITTSPASGADGAYSTGYVEGRMRARVLIPPATIAPFGYLTPQDEFGDVERGNPLPYTLPPEKRRQVGLEHDTWRLEIIADPESNTRLERPLSNKAGTSIDFATLLKIGETRAARYVKALTCNNIGEPLGMGLWEGVPLRDLIWMAGPTENLRRVYYYGYHNDDPAQVFQSSLPIGRVLEDAPGELPVIVCYKVNGEFLNGRRGGPVRMIVPEAYGFKSVKWLQRIILTNDYRANDTYHSGNNDLESPMKTFARFYKVPSVAKAGEPIHITGIAQVGVSGLAKVQYWLHPKDAPLPSTAPASPFAVPSAFGTSLSAPDSLPLPIGEMPSAPGVPQSLSTDPTFAHGDWRDADPLSPPQSWGGGLPDGPLLDVPLQFDPETGVPHQWPLKYTVAHWSATLRGIPAGTYDLRCRSIDLNGIAQPMPRPFPKSGRAAIQTVQITVEP